MGYAPAMAEPATAPPTDPLPQTTSILVPIVQAPRSAFGAWFYGALGAIVAVAFVAILVGAIIDAFSTHSTATVQGLHPPTLIASAHH